MPTHIITTTPNLLSFTPKGHDEVLAEKKNINANNKLVYKYMIMTSTKWQATDYKQTINDKQRACLSITTS